jgi:hypothetical protein
MYQHNIVDFSYFTKSWYPAESWPPTEFWRRGKFADIKVGGFLVDCRESSADNYFIMRFMEVVAINKGKIYVSDANGTYGLKMCHLESHGPPYADTLSKKPSSCRSISKYIDTLPLVDGLEEDNTYDFGRLYHW